MAHLEFSQAGNDGIGKVPKEIGNLVNLEYLDFSELFVVLGNVNVSSLNWCINCL